jgi:hypothetical protein
MENNNISVIRYIALFSAVYAGLMLLLNAFVYGFNIDIGSSANIAMLLGAAYGAIIKFVSDQKRMPSKSEKQKLIWGCILSSFAISLAIVATVLISMVSPSAWEELKDLLHQISIPVWLGIFLLVTLLYYAVLNFIYGWGAKQLAKKLPADTSVPRN